MGFGLTVRRARGARAMRRGKPSCETADQGDTAAEGTGEQSRREQDGEGGSQLQGKELRRKAEKDKDGS